MTIAGATSQAVVGSHLIHDRYSPSLKLGRIPKTHGINFGRNCTDVGDASYASVPLLVSVCRKQSMIDWNTFAIVATIELARAKGRNPALPDWLEAEYFQAIRELAEIGTSQILHTEDMTTARAILSVVAIAKGLFTHAKFLLAYTEDELLEMESRL